MANLDGQAGEVEFTIEVKRAETGKVETYTVTGRIADNGSNTSSGGPPSSD